MIFVLAGGIGRDLSYVFVRANKYILLAIMSTIEYTVPNTGPGSLNLKKKVNLEVKTVKVKVGSRSRIEI